MPFDIFQPTSSNVTCRRRVGGRKYYGSKFKERAYLENHYVKDVQIILHEL